jgi:hypothetical protein
MMLKMQDNISRKRSKNCKEVDHFFFEVFKILYFIFHIKEWKNSEF